MRKLLSILLVLIAIFALTACDASAAIKDGTYRAEFDTFDTYGYKDFVEIKFENGTVTEVTMDAMSEEDGSLKSESNEYRESMEGISGTYPAKYYQDLINQYIESGDSSGVLVVAGATSTSNSILKLLTALETELKAGTYQGTVLVPRD
ncbi:MAG: FMN-binding protein [Oscillospiraceae bacterium]|nr:FMN-binding protein [Oscillospiraceae bacterium]